MGQAITIGVCLEEDITTRRVKDYLERSVLLRDVILAASAKGTLKIENMCATMNEFARKLPVLIAFAIDVGNSTWHFRYANSKFSIVATPNTFDCFKIFE